MIGVMGGESEREDANSVYGQDAFGAAGEEVVETHGG